MKYRETGLASLLFALIMVAGCNSSGSTDEVESIIKKTKAHFVPDTRIALFDVRAELVDGNWLLKGETTIPEANDALLDSLSALDLSVTDSIAVLPGSGLEGKTFGIVNNSVANIRSRPSHPAQLATQALLGMPLEILKKEGGWYLVKTPEDYISWVDSGGIERMDKSQYNQWKDAPKLIYENTYGFSYQEASESAGKVTDLVAGNILKLERQTNSFYEVSYPDGRRAYIPTDEATPFEEWNSKLNVNQESLVEVAETMMGAPYLWGGTSTKGIDCSGFTKTIYFMNGRIIPRDASQQIHAGTLVDNQKEFGNLQVGDLLFFGKEATDSTSRRVVHVGMWIGNNEFIHSSGKVRISSIDSTANNFDAYNLNRYLEARRYLDNWEGNIIQTAQIYSALDKN